MESEKVMNCVEFNEKYKNHLREGSYGMSIEDEDVIAYMNHEFGKEIKKNPNFEYSQIKLKFGVSRVYTNSDLDIKWEKGIDFILDEK